MFEALLPAAMLGMSIYNAIENKSERDRQKEEKRAAIKYNPYRKAPIEVPKVQGGSIAGDLLAGGLGAASMYQNIGRAEQAANEAAAKTAYLTAATNQLKSVPNTMAANQAQLLGIDYNQGLNQLQLDPAMMSQFGIAQANPFWNKGM